MDAVQIKIELLKRGIKQADIARRLGVSRSAVSHVISGRGRSARIEKYIRRLIARQAA